MTDAYKLSLGTTPFFTIGFVAILYFIHTCIMYLINSSNPISWDAATCFVCCYGFLYIGINQLNIHSENINKLNSEK